MGDLVASPRELLTEDEQSRARAFGVPPLLLIAARGRVPHGNFEVRIRDAAEAFSFDRCVICPDHVWVTLIGQGVDSVNVYSKQVLEVRIADVQLVIAHSVFDVQPSGIQQDSGIRVTPPEFVPQPDDAAPIAIDQTSIQAAIQGLTTEQLQALAALVDLGAISTPFNSDS